MINVSGGTIVSCENAVSEDCAADFPWDGGDAVASSYPKVTEWRQCDAEGTTFTDDSSIAFTCDDNDLDDQSWENPYDVAKGHRGFIDGDFIMMMYAWSPNWKANSVGNDHYNLYVRRSFDGGETWTTTPEDWDPVDDDGMRTLMSRQLRELQEHGTEITRRSATTYGETNSNRPVISPNSQATKKPSLTRATPPPVESRCCPSPT